MDNDVTTAVLKQLADIQNGLAALTGLKDDIRELKDDVKELRKDVGELKTEVGVLSMSQKDDHTAIFGQDGLAKQVADQEKTIHSMKLVKNFLYPVFMVLASILLGAVGSKEVFGHEPTQEGQTITQRPRTWAIDDKQRELLMNFIKEALKELKGADQ